MSDKGFSSELKRALERPDADELASLADAYERYSMETDHHGEWPDEWAEAFGDMLDWPERDPDKALAFIVIAASRMNDSGTIGVLACGPFEDLLREPSQDMLSRIEAEARKSARFRWLLDHPFKVAVSAEAWEVIQKFRTTGPHEEPPNNTMPKTYFC